MRERAAAAVATAGSGPWWVRQIEVVGGWGSKAEDVPVRNKAMVACENVATCWKKPMVQACVRVGTRALGRRACALIRQPW